MRSVTTKLLCVAAGVSLAAVSSTHAQPIGMAFTYQGQLKQWGVPVNGTADIEFTFWNAFENGDSLGDLRYLEVEVVDGLFTVALDVGPDMFTGDARWLEVAVRYPAGEGSYTLLTPRQQITPTPYALALPDLHTREGNILGGSASVFSEVARATISGGGSNTVSDSFGTVGGGGGNSAGDWIGSTSDAGYATVCGGRGNEAAAAYATVAGGKDNQASGPSSTVGGGENNVAAGSWSTVPGGYFNSAGGQGSFAAGLGATVRPDDYGTFIWADTSGGNHMSTGPNQFLIRAVGGVGIGTNAPTAQLEVANDSDPTIVVRAKAVYGSDAGIHIRGSRNSDTEASVAYVEFRDFDSNEGPDGTDFAMSKVAGGMHEPTGMRGDLRMYTNNGTGLAERMRIDAEGWVGMGTVAPAAHLDITSENPIWTGINIKNVGSDQRFLIQVNGTNPGEPGRVGNLEIWGTGPSGNHNVFTAAPDGKVGINTDAPTNALSVDGAVDFSGLLGIGTATPTANLDVVSADSVATTVKLVNTSSAQHFLLQVNGDNPGGENREGSFEVWGLGPEGTYSLLTATADGRVGVNTYAPRNAFSVDGVADFSDRVGIGTSSPGYAVPSSKLEVSGGHIAVSNSYGVFSSNSAGDAIGAGFDTEQDDALDLYAGGSRKLRITPDGQVGIGTDIPGNALSVAGGADFSEKVRIGATELGYTLANTALEVSEGNIMLGNAGGIVSVNSAGTGIGAGFRTGTSGDLYLYGDGAVRVHVAPDGKVGIGSSPPSDRLTVGGTIRSTIGGFKFPDGSVLTSADGANIWSKSGTDAYYNDGNVGIGTSSPQDRLDILNGNITMDTGASGSSALRFRHDGNLRWTFLYRSWATNEFGLYNESAGKWGMTFTSDTNRLGVGRTSPGHPLHIGTDATNGNGAHLTADGVWTQGSDRNAKHRVRPLNTRDVLEKVISLLITEWEYKGANEGVKHIGPMAQDFFDAFGLGGSDKHIGTIDADGVALAAIQGLHQMVKERDTKIETLRNESASLRARLEQLERIVAELATTQEGDAR